MEEAVGLIQPYLASYGVAALFVLVFLEALGAPVPGETAIIAASSLAAEGQLSLPHALIAIFCGAVLGDCTGYVIGRTGGHALLTRYGPRFKLTPERLKQLEDLFRSRGIYIVMTARFVVILRQLNGIIAGSVRMPWQHFLPANMVGALLWTLVWGVGPYVTLHVIQPFVTRWWG
ncbi:DedA family protein [Bosea sp. BK604]|uniref:DedA family protein n=1 Tax=Bosea sp. BK604 TaxID=2512180 RepID=UPI0010446222|nr:DedA family protein [Bosea sp. BK604]TCR63979.1 membrane protein DedA with SNARE-associated domain [Bosea sp. BK604]